MAHSRQRRSLEQYLPISVLREFNHGPECRNLPAVWATIGAERHRTFCAGARAYSRVVSVPRSTAPTSRSARRCHAQATSVEPSSRNGHRDQPIRRVDDDPSCACCLGFRPEQTRISGWHTCSGAAAPAFVYTLYRSGRARVSHPQTADGSQAA